jgi:hypothetical protein
MNPLSASAEVKTNVQVLPTHSQVFLVAIVVLAMVLVICGTILLMYDNLDGFWLEGFALVLLAASFWGWQKSQPDTDMHQAHPTQITLPNGTSLTTDGRILKSAEGLRGLTGIIQEMLIRQPLPEPDGLVDGNAKLIPGSAAIATELTKKINSETQSATNSLIDILGLADVNQETTANLNVTQNTAAADSQLEENVVQGLNIPAFMQERT